MENQLTGSKHKDPVVRADLFGKYGESKLGSSHGKHSNRHSNEPVTFQRRSNDTENRASLTGVTDGYPEEVRSLQDEGLEGIQWSAKKGMSWTSQYGHFMHQLERMKQELEAVGEENLELANLITDS